ncbi:MAG: Nif3-like dinuclear metal center hexameric protein [Myxococcales bacterium]|nr:Nif3-like dinuclear metal center hexameric protein [Myxococcales bacterium]
MISLSELCEYLDRYLNLKMFRDMSQNGLQVEGAQQIEHIALAVDARQQTFEQAAACGAQMLLCHHGLFWGRSELLRGHHYKRIKMLLQHDIALYAAHLPLDAHPEVGNNVVLAHELQLQDLQPWGDYKGQTIGIRGRLARAMKVERFAERFEKVLAPYDGFSKLFGQGKSSIRDIAIITGDAAMDFFQAANDGLDLLITGETNHIVAMVADELGAYLLCGGHYATEVWGVRALGKHLEEKFGIQTTFLHVPTYV